MCECECVLACMEVGDVWEREKERESRANCLVLFEGLNFDLVGTTGPGSDQNLGLNLPPRSDVLLLILLLILCMC